MPEDFYLVEIEDLHSPPNISEKLKLNLQDDDGFRTRSATPAFFSDQEERGFLTSRGNNNQIANGYSPRSAPFTATTRNFEQDAPYLGAGGLNKQAKSEESPMADIGVSGFSEIEALRSQLGIERRINALQARQLANYKSSYEEVLLRIEAFGESGEEAHTTHLEIELEKTIKEQEKCERYCSVLEKKNQRLKLEIQEQRAVLRTIAMERRYKRALGNDDEYVLKLRGEEHRRERID